MQIDFHHAVTYVVARLSDFNHDEASIIAYSAQYVDDAVDDAKIIFEDGAIYSYMCSAHKTKDLENLDPYGNHMVWLPFHFLPGNAGNSFLEKAVCLPNSIIAQEMVKDCIDNREKAFGLHRLGITMHVYADTWAHQNFVGAKDDVNSASEIFPDDNLDLDLWSKLQNLLVGQLFPVGHGAVNTYPDMPFLTWSYKNWKGEKIDCVNANRFMEAIENMHIAMSRYKMGDPRAEVESIPGEVLTKICTLFNSIHSITGERRHAVWLKVIERGDFPFGKATVNYDPKSWEEEMWEILGRPINEYDPKKKFKYNENFAKCHWKLFNEAIHFHRFKIIHEILPKHGICAA